MNSNAAVGPLKTSPKGVCTPFQPIHAQVTWQDLDKADIESLGCLSVVIDPNAEWQSTGILIPHEAIRYNMLQMERAVQPQYFQPTRAWKVKRFFDWFDEQFASPVHSHHHTEDTMFFPMFLKKPGAVMSPRLSDDHLVLLKQLKEIGDMRTAFTGTTDPAQLNVLAQQLRQRVHEMCDLLREHLSEEEVIIPGLITQHFTKPDFEIMVKKIVKEGGIQSIKEIPFLALCQRRAGGARLHDLFISQLPRPLRWYYRNYSSTWPEVENTRMIGSLCVDSDVAPELPKIRGWGPFKYYKVKEKAAGK